MSDRVVFLVMEPLDGGQKTVTAVQGPNEEEVFENLRMTPSARPYRATLVVLSYSEQGVEAKAYVKNVPDLRPEEPMSKRLGS